VLQQTLSGDPTAAASARERLRVLIVEDSEDDAVLLTRELESAVDLSYLRVACARDLRDALAASDWDLVISDHSMPSFSATEAFELVRASGKDIPFIIYSGHMSAPAAAKAMAAGVHDFVEKGNVSRLMPVIRRELKGIVARQRAESHVYQLAHYDQLTGLPNRELFSERASARLARNPQARCALLFADLDRFMRINNTFGYAIGDLLVQQVAQRLERCAGPDALVGHFGRDEFVLLSGELRGDGDAQAFAQAVMREFAAPFVIDGKEFYITLSMGLTAYPEHGSNVLALLVNAESAMFVAKRSGRNNCQVYRPELNAASAERLTLETALRKAVGNGELLLQYQPILDLGSERVIGTEALVRWRHAALGVLGPDRFIPLADESGMITEIGEWVLFEACRQARRWHDQGHGPLSVAVNVSAVQFRQRGLLNTVAEALSASGLAPSHLELEITEGVLMQDADTTVGTLRGLKNMGVRISVDDFGTGYSSLAYLKRFPIDMLKIDRSFTRDVIGDADNAAIVRAIITLARSLKLTVVAEGVETPAQLEFLRNEGCDRMQGFLLARPLDPAALAPLLARETALV